MRFCSRGILIAAYHPRNPGAPTAQDAAASQLVPALQKRESLWVRLETMKEADMVQCDIRKRTSSSLAVHMPRAGIGGSRRQRAPSDDQTAAAQPCC